MDYQLSQKNEKAFEISYLQIKQFYFDYKYLLPQSQRMEYFCGLFLLHLLSQNRITEYCSELELLELQHFDNQYISLPVDIEHYISEGNYSKLLSLQNALTDPSYLYYLSKLNSSIRYEVARSAERSFTSVSIVDACEMLLLKDQNELIAFINQEAQKNDGEQEITWQIQDSRVCFKESVNKDKIVIPSNKIMTDTLKLAYELEKII